VLLLPNVHHVFFPFMVRYYHCPYIVLLVGVSLEAKKIAKCLQVQQTFTYKVYIYIPKIVWLLFSVNFFAYIEDDMLIIWIWLCMNNLQIGDIDCTSKRTLNLFSFCFEVVFDLSTLHFSCIMFIVKSESHCTICKWYVLLHFAKLEKT
jgi:hypothetical protein